jgi:hypothetical protein
MIVAKAMAPAPFGQTLTIRNSVTTPITTRVRPASIRAGSQSGTRSRTTPRCAGQAKRVINKQSKTVERMRHARQHFSRLVGEQAQRRRADRQGD